MTRKQQLEQRRAINQAIGKRDAENRCAFCRRPFPHGQTDLLRALGGHVGYCTDDCKTEADDARKALEAAR